MASNLILIRASVLLIFGLILLGQVHESSCQGSCPFICVETDYMTCPATGDEHLKAPCNCCFENSTGCVIYATAGYTIQC
ncbi:hypothetical protein AKJ16_DCAP13147 [Drosera capensis]